MNEDIIKTFIGAQYPIVLQIINYLPFKDIVCCQRVSKLWNHCSNRVLFKRRFLVELFAWKSKTAPPIAHPWFHTCGNQLLSIHGRIGLNDSLCHWIQNSLKCNPAHVILFARGVYYLSYLKSIQNHLVVYQELSAAHRIQSLFQKPQTTLFTALRVMDTTGLSSSEEDLPDVTLLSIPPSIHKEQIVAFNILDSDVDLPNLIDTKLSFEVVAEYFYGLTGVHPSKERILGIIGFNLADLIHFIRRLYQDVGPFSFIGCDSEALSWSFLSRQNSLNFSDNYEYCSTGFVITGGPNRNIRTGSVVLDISIRTEKDIIRKLRPFVQEGLTGYGSWAILLSSCVRGYQGEDIDSEIIRQKNYLQKLECDTFRKVCVGTKLIAAQVEDIFGVDYITEMPSKKSSAHFSKEFYDEMSLLTPEIVSDDSSTVIFIVKYI